MGVEAVNDPYRILMNMLMDVLSKYTDSQGVQCCKNLHGSGYSQSVAN